MRFTMVGAGHVGDEPLLMLKDEDGVVRPEGVRDGEDRIGGTYVRGLLDEGSACQAFQSRIQPGWVGGEALPGRRQRLRGQLDRWNGHLSRHLDHRRLLAALDGAARG